MKMNNLKKITLAAMFAALTVVATILVKVPIGTNGGYIHLGDSIIYLGACFLGPYGIVAAAIGGALADILSGAAAWALSSTIIKALISVPFVVATHLYFKRKNTFKIINLWTILMTLVSGVITVLGYYLAEGIMYSFPAAWASVPFNVIQAVGSAVVFILLGCALDAMKIQKYLK
ncbi:MAG: TIGR04002 family protein [Acutalibacteraceae bacterium]